MKTNMPLVEQWQCKGQSPSDLKGMEPNKWVKEFPD